MSGDFVVPVDAECTANKEYIVYEEDGKPYCAILSLVNIYSNQNKFLSMQVLQHKTGKYAILERTGRIGTIGRKKLKQFDTCVSKAKEEFIDKFKDKTDNNWQHLDSFSHVVGKYDFLKIDLNPQNEFVLKENDLDPPIQSLLGLLYNRKTMSMLMKEIGYDSANAPFGLFLSCQQIEEGYRALKKIENLSSGHAFNDLVQACEEFYMKIPHNFGRKMPNVIQTKEDIEEELEMLKTLKDVKVATEDLNKAASENPLYISYKKFKYSLKLLDSSGEEFSALLWSLFKTHGPTHKNFIIEVDAVYSCHFKENSSFKSYGNNILLWHGSRLTNLIGILENGLKIAPAEAPSTGYAFGKGIYFADVSTKSANYLFPTMDNNEGLLLLCEVSLGNPLSLTEVNETLPHSLPAEYNSVIGKGRFTPTSFEMSIPSSEAKMACGPLREDSTHTGFLLYNEYIVYDVNQVQLKYLFRIKIHKKNWPL